ncbi:MAG: transposase [Cognaticolwellia sp.]|jgi:transposase
MHLSHGFGVKAHAVYFSQYQLLPYNRIEEYFSDQLGIPISAGSLFNFNEQAAALVKSSGTEDIIKAALQSPHQALHVDETGINTAVNGGGFMVHQQRGRLIFTLMKKEEK